MKTAPAPTEKDNKYVRIPVEDCNSDGYDDGAGDFVNETDW